MWGEKSTSGCHQRTATVCGVSPMFGGHVRLGFAQIAAAKGLRAKTNKMGERGHPYVVPHRIAKELAV